MIRHEFVHQYPQVGIATGTSPPADWHFRGLSDTAKWRAETSASGAFRRCGVLRERLKIGDHEHLAVGTRLQCPIGVSGAIERESPGDLADDCGALHSQGQRI